MTHTIFIADENRATALSTALILNQCESKFQTLLCNGPHGAVQLAQAVRPDLVLMDVPRDPRETLICGMALREIYSVEVILMSAGIGLERNLLHVIPQRVRPFPVIQKPMEPASLVEKVQRHLGGRTSQGLTNPAQFSLPEVFCRSGYRHGRTGSRHQRLQQLAL